MVCCYEPSDTLTGATRLTFEDLLHCREPYAHGGNVRETDSAAENMSQKPTLPVLIRGNTVGTFMALLVARELEQTIFKRIL